MSYSKDFPLHLHVKGPVRPSFGVHPNDAAAGIQERATRVAWIDGGIGLDTSLDRPLTDVQGPRLARDDALAPFKQSHSKRKKVMIHHSYIINIQ